MSVRYGPVFLALLAITCGSHAILDKVADAVGDALGKKGGVVDAVGDAVRDALGHGGLVDDLTDNLLDLDDHLGSPLEKLGLTTLPNGFFLALSIKAGVGHQAYSLFTQMNRNDDNNLVKTFLPRVCKKLGLNLQCNRLFRSKILDNWDILPIERVRVGVYKDNKEQAFFEFDARGSSLTSWFSQKRLVASSYIDLKTAKTNYFSIEGHGKVLRRFFINANYGGCPKDRGWLMVGDGITACPWEKRGGKNFPRIFYSKMKTAGRYSNKLEVGIADFLVISVKMRRPTCS